MDWKASMKQALRVGVPFIGLETPDTDASIKAMREMVKVPLVTWTCTEGWMAGNESAKAIVSELSDRGLPLTNPIGAVQKLRAVAESGRQFVAVMEMAGHVLGSSPLDYVQAVRSCRNLFKMRGCLLVMAGYTLALPVELASDTVLLSESLPTGEERDTIIEKVLSDFAESVPGAPAPTPRDKDRAREATNGLTAFGVEQTIAMSLSPKAGLMVDVVWERVKKVISQTPGLSLVESPMTFGSIGGCDNAKSFLKRLHAGEKPFTTIVRMEEVEKAFSGIGTDSSGVATEMLGEFLAWSSRIQADGCIFYGQPGAAKSVLAEAAATELGVLCIDFNLTACKGSLVGESSAKMRRAMNIIESISDGKPFLIATSNSLATLPGELLRRFRLPTFFFDLPTVEERNTIWEIYRKRYELPYTSTVMNDAHGNNFDEGWTGAEIEVCCELAWRLGIPLAEAAEMVIPLSVSDAATIDGRRKGAHLKYLSASQPGKYTHGGKPEMALTGGGRKFASDDE